MNGESMVLSRYSKVFQCREEPESLILFSTKETSVVRISKSVIRDIERDNLTEDEKKTLRRLGFLVKSRGDEKNEMRSFTNKLNATRRDLSATVVMNLDCNLACTYCFQGRRKGKYYMSKETADTFIEFVKKTIISSDPAPLSSEGRGKGKKPSERGGRNIDEISLTFYGGEPLLSYKLIIYISKQLKQLAEENGITYSFSLITNGTLLTESVVRQMKPLGLISAKITLDGPKAVHDLSRPFVSGLGSFDVIARNLKAATNMMEIQIGGNYTTDNYADFPLLLDVMIESGLGPDRISVVKFDPVMNESPEFAPPHFHSGCMSVNEPWLWEAGLFLREEILRRGYQTPRFISTVCMIEQTDNLVINYDGSIFKCPGLIGRRNFCAGDLQTGLQDFRQSHHLGNYRNDECLECSYLPLCFGGCRYMKVIRDGNMEGVDCKKPFFDATLEAFVLQDITYSGQLSPSRA